MSAIACSRCAGAPVTGQRYCLPCRAAWMREWRKTHRLSPEQRKKANARRTATIYVERGKLKPQLCEACGSESAEKHHEDYSRPLDVHWLCRPCHISLHRGTSLTLLSGAILGTAGGYALARRH